VRATRAPTHFIQGRSNVSLASLPRPTAGAAPLVLTLLVTACGGGPTAPVDTDTFVAAVVALRTQAVAAETPAEYERRRGEALAELGVTEADLRAYVDAWADDPAHMAGVWAAIRETVLERGVADMDLPIEDGDPASDGPPEADGNRARPLPQLAPGRIR